MIHSARFSIFPVAVAAVLILPLGAASQVSVEGAWTATEWTVNGQSSAAQRGIFVFTSTHYSFFFINQAEARAEPAQAGPGGMTDAEKVVAYDEFTANAGRYVVEGNTLTTQAYVAKNPGYMAGWPDNETQLTVEREGDTLTMTFGNGNVVTLVRREGMTPG